MLLFTGSKPYSEGHVLVVKGTIYTSQFKVGGYPRCMSGMYESDCQDDNQNYKYLLYIWSG